MLLFVGFKADTYVAITHHCICVPHA